MLELVNVETLRKEAERKIFIRDGSEVEGI